MEKETMTVIVEGEQFGGKSKIDKKKEILLKASNTSQLQRELAVTAWAEALDRLAIDFVYKPIVKVDGKTYHADFYLKNMDTFLIVKANSIDVATHDETLNELAHATERDVVVGYSDGKFKLADYFDYKDRLETGEMKEGASLYLDDQVFLCICAFCDEWYFCTDVSWWGCRNCHYYDGNGTMAFYHFGYESIFDLTADLFNRKIMKYKNDFRKTITIREKLFGK